MALAAASPPIFLEDRLRLRSMVVWFKIVGCSKRFSAKGDRIYHKQDLSRHVEEIIRDAPIQEWNDQTPSPRNWRLTYEGVNINLDDWTPRNGMMLEIVARQTMPTAQLFKPKNPLREGVLVLSSHQPEIRSQIFDDTTIVLPHSSFSFVELVHSQYVKVKKKMKEIELRRLECMTRANISILKLLMIINVCESAVRMVNICDVEATGGHGTTITEMSQLGQTLRAFTLSTRVRVTVTELV